MIGARVFVSIVGDALGDTLRSVILYGSVAFGDLAPGYGGLDFVAIVDNDIADDRREALIEARRPLRSGLYGVYARMIEGAFLPRHMTCPQSAGRVVWWGTSGERLWESSWLGWFDCLGIRKRGVVIHGEDLRCEFPTPTREQLAAEAARFVATVRRHGRGGELHSVDWRAHLQKGAWLRRNPDQAKSGGVIAWLCTLDAPIQEACCELEAELSKTGS